MTSYLGLDVLAESRLSHQPPTRRRSPPNPSPPSAPNAREKGTAEPVHHFSGLDPHGFTERSLNLNQTKIVTCLAGRSFAEPEPNFGQAGPTG